MARKILRAIVLAPLFLCLGVVLIPYIILRAISELISIILWDGGKYVITHFRNR